MKALYPNLVTEVIPRGLLADTTVTGTEAKMLNPYPRDVWEGDAATFLVESLISGTSDTFTMFNTDSSSVTARVFPNIASTLNTNGNFDSFTGPLPDNWTVEGNLTSSQVGGGDTGFTNAVQLVAGGSTSKNMYQDFAVTADTVHRLKYIAKANGSDGGQYYIYDVSNAADIVSLTDIPDNDNNFNYDLAVFTTPTGCTSLRIGFTPKANGDTLILTGVSTLVQLEAIQYVLGGATTYYELITDTGFTWNFLWAEYTEVSGAHSIIADITSRQSTTTVGIIRAGAVVTTNDPAPGLGEGLIDTSNIKEFRFGGVYIKDRGRVSTFDLTLDLKRSTQGDNLFRGVIRAIGFNSTPWLVTELNNEIWPIFGKIQEQPPMSIRNYDTGLIDLRLEEVL